MNYCLLIPKKSIFSRGMVCFLQNESKISRDLYINKLDSNFSFLTRLSKIVENATVSIHIINPTVIRRLHLCVIVVLRLVNCLNMGIKEQEVTTLIVFKLSAVFDKVDFDNLLAVLSARCSLTCVVSYLVVVLL